VIIPTHNCFTALYLGLPSWAGARLNLLLDFVVQRKITWGRHTDNLARCHSIWTNQRPTSITPILCQMPFLLQPFQFIVAWDKHQICWSAYPVAWLLWSFQIQTLQNIRLIMQNSASQLPVAVWSPHNTYVWYQPVLVSSFTGLLTPTIA